jgi:rod shape-determining protein MreD
VIVTPRIAVRIGLLIVAGVLLQVAFFSRLSLFAASADILPAVIVALALLGGSLAGAVCGFSAGLLLDVMLYQTLGATSLSLILAGYAAGRYRESFDVSGPFVAPVLAAMLTLLSILAFSTIQVMLGVSAQVSPLVVRDSVFKAIFNLLLMPPIYGLIRRVLRPALIEDSPRRSLLASAIRTAGR